MRSELCGNINRGRTVSAADNADSARLSFGKAEENRACEGNEDTDLSRSAEDKALGVGDQRTEVGHTADAEEDERWIDTELNALVEIVEKTAVGGVLVVNLSAYFLNDVTCRGRVVRALDFYQTDVRSRHDLGIEIDKQHAESDGKQQKRFILLFDCEIEQKARNADHYVILPTETNQS